MSEAIYKPKTQRARRTCMTGNDAATYYERCGLAALERNDWEASDIYFEWARIEREKANGN